MNISRHAVYISKFSKNNLITWEESLSLYIVYVRAFSHACNLYCHCFFFCCWLLMSLLSCHISSEKRVSIYETSEGDRRAISLSSPEYAGNFLWGYFYRREDEREIFSVIYRQSYEDIARCFPSFHTCPAHITSLLQETFPHFSEAFSSLWEAERRWGGMLLFLSIYGISPWGDRAERVSLLSQPAASRWQKRDMFKESVAWGDIYIFSVSLLLLSLLLRLRYRGEPI